MSNFKDKATADFNNQFPPKINNTKPLIINKKFMNFNFARIYIFITLRRNEKIERQKKAAQRTHFPLVLKNQLKLPFKYLQYYI